ILVGIFSSNLLYHKKDCFPTLLRVVAVFFIARFFTAPFFQPPFIHIYTILPHAVFVKIAYDIL
ncbi:MAG: hypothetical protein UCO74_11605, partial [Ruminococcus sp.]|uniref:hypothetical protein n=1 Tax=Ruminococcus sp. TaxID=41978 RepID=UPI002E7A8D69